MSNIASRKIMLSSDMNAATPSKNLPLLIGGGCLLLACLLALAGGEFLLGSGKLSN